MKVAIIDYGVGNLASLKYALERCGVNQVLVTSDRSIISAADRIVFPGVGHAKFAMERLRQTGLHCFIPTLKQPVLGVCLGMQLMCRSTQEGDVEGLGIFSAEVKRIECALKVPHMGWNTVHYIGHESESAHFYYFVHGYYADLCDHTIAYCDYGQRFSAVLSNGNFLGCQFHPEKSGLVGENFLKKFLS
jgi:glutamine amidotransferase